MTERRLLPCVMYAVGTRKSDFCIIVSDILIYEYYSLYLCKEITYAEQTTIKTI